MDSESSKREGESSVLTKLRIFFIARNIHFCIFNSVLLDGFFFSARAISHMHISEGIGYLNFAMSLLMIFLLSSDLFENIKTSEELSYTTNQFHFDLIEKAEEDFCKKLLSTKNS